MLKNKKYNVCFIGCLFFFIDFAIREQLNAYLAIYQANGFL